MAEGQNNQTPKTTNDHVGLLHFFPLNILLLVSNG